jgi:arsenical pump membrane protein
MALAVAALFVVIDAALQLGLKPALASLAGDGTSAAALARVAGSGALAANAVNNLPAYIALEAVTADAPQRLMALLIGVNVAPLVTPWASLATLLWAQRCHARGIRIPVRSLAVQGLLCAVVAGGLALGALALRA